ncbi:hypothetical protein ABI59_19665 [Acidobacteria bacterium Mor1]|nr:hypothetical protein ABI59_19665 [Acidobacteria bacterium Mor1]
MKLEWKLAKQARRAARFKKALGPHVKALIVESENGVFAVDPEDETLGGALRHRGKYSLEELERLRRFVTPESRVLVVGAHIGTLAIPLAGSCREVVAIEANPHTYDLLVKNIALNNAANCRALHLAANDREEPVEFLLSRVNSGGSKRVPRVRKFIYYYDDPETVSVPSAPLDSVIEDHDFDLIVMDIEGSEYFALKGMPEILSNARALAVEFLPHHLKHVSGVTVEEFLAVIPRHFTTLTVPTLNRTVESAEFLPCLSEMYRNDQGDDGLIFERAD